MKWFWLVCVGAILFLATCSAPTAPRLPRDDTEEPTKPDTSKTGFLHQAPDGLTILV